MPYLLAFIVGLFLIAAVLRIDFFFYILYLFFGFYFFSRLWTEKAIKNLVFSREYSGRSFLGERVTVRLRIRNQGLLPVPWLRVHESVPIHLRSPSFFLRVLSLLPHEEKSFTYELNCRRRGFYRLGPLMLSSGDLFGIRTSQRRLETDDAVMVYPRIVPLSDIGLPSQTPFGQIRAKQHIFEDPSRMVGVREYQSGDSIRHIHWKASATTGALQIKRFEPAISIEAQIFLNLNRSEYSTNRAETASELAIVTAASIANHLTEKRQTIGLSCNGIDPLMGDGHLVALPPHRGRDQLMRILDILARIQLGEGASFNEVLRRARLQLTWGGTAIIISAHASEALFDIMVLMKRSGFHVTLVLVDPQRPFVNTRDRARQIGIRAYQVWQEKDLDVWR